ncbi:hypothetical protein [uncultured Paracoccus sp.]|uniref:hypothetical protein n=1 Tax=uncultured Paracoccus sp. TaxID=189685 RepID=UPI002631D3ED|nr:hypothetical protein [uncultured Paracoccus sp.]
MKIDSRHHVILESKVTDFERIEDIGADAIRATRRALDWCDLISGDAAVQLRRELADLRDIVERRSAMTRDARVSLRAFRDALMAQGQGGPDTALAPLVSALHDAITASERVADLLASERHIGRCRGIS